MKKEVKISIRGRQTVEGESEVVEVFTDGNFYKKNDSYYIVYQSEEDTSFKGATTTVKIEKNKVVMLRSAPVESQLIIEKGNRHLCSYNTGYGNVMIGINGSKIDVDLNERGGKIKFKYTIDVNSALLSSHEVTIFVEEK